MHVLLASRLRGPESGYMLSLAGGVAVGYVFTDILPAVCRGQAVVEQTAVYRFFFLERRMFIAALIGLVLFYGLLRQIKLARLRQEARAARLIRNFPAVTSGCLSRATPLSAFWWAIFS